MTWPTVVWLLECVILACLLVAIATDLVDRIIPNRVALVVLICGIGLRLMGGPGALLASLLAAAAIAVALGLLAARDLLGWGDVKLIAAVSFAVPADRVVTLLFAITIAGGLLSCLYLTARLLLRHAAFLAADAVPTGDGAPPEDAAQVASGGGLIRRLTYREGVRIHANEPMPYALAVFGGVAFGLAAE